MDSNEFRHENQIHFSSSANLCERRKVSLGTWSFAISWFNYLRRISHEGWRFFENLYRGCRSWRLPCIQSRYELTKRAWRRVFETWMFTWRSFLRADFIQSWESFPTAGIEETDDVYQYKAWWCTRQESPHKSDLRSPKRRVPQPFRCRQSGLLQKYAR